MAKQYDDIFSIPTKVRSQISILIEERVRALRSVKLQRDIAREAGFTNPNMITMLKQGNAKVAIDRVPLLAKALEVNQSYMMRLALEQFYSPEITKIINEDMGGAISSNEREIIDLIRKVSGNTDPSLSDESELGIALLFTCP